MLNNYPSRLLSSIENKLQPMFIHDTLTSTPPTAGVCLVVDTGHAMHKMCVQAVLDSLTPA